MSRQENITKSQTNKDQAGIGRSASDAFGLRSSPLDGLLRNEDLSTRVLGLGPVPASVSGKAPPSPSTPVAAITKAPAPEAAGMRFKINLGVFSLEGPFNLRQFFRRPRS